MKYIVVDLEMNPIQSKLKQERKICKNEIIQIGAVCLNEDYDEIEENNIPENQRLTYDPYADIPEIPEASPRKKAYVDIREVMGIVDDLKYRGLPGNIYSFC